MKRQRELEKAKQLEKEMGKKQNNQEHTSEEASIQSTSNIYIMEQVKQQQHLPQSPAFHGINRTWNSPGINLPCFSPLRPRKRRNTRVVH